MLLWNAATGMRGHASSLEMHHEHGKLLGCAWRDETRWAITSAVRLREAERGCESARVACLQIDTCQCRFGPPGGYHRLLVGFLPFANVLRDTRSQVSCRKRSVISLCIDSHQRSLSGDVDASSNPFGIGFLPRSARHTRTKRCDTLSKM